MPDLPEILAECRRQAERFETHWSLPWYGGGAEKVWGHVLVRVLLNLPDDVFTEAATALLAEPSFALRGVAVHLVNARKFRALAPRVREALATDESVQVRALAAAALGGLGLEAENGAALAAIPDSAHPELKKSAIMALRLAGSADGAPLAARWMNRAGEDEGVKVAAAAALGELGGDTARAALAALLESPGEPDNARAAAAEALGRLGGEGVEDALARASGDARAWVQARSIEALARVAGARHLERIAAATGRDRPWMVRLAAVGALATAGGESARARLVALLEDPDAKVRAEACAALATFAGAASLAPLGRALRDADLFVRIQAASALEKVSGRTFGVAREVGKEPMDVAALTAAIERARAFAATL